MTITVSKTIAVILIICLAIIVICDLLLAILKLYQKRLDKKERKYKIAIGKHDENINRENRTFLAGKDDTGGKE